MSAKQILVVEDERPIREMIAFGLRRAGFEVREAGDARSGRAEVANKLPDLLLVDWMLPDTSGLEFTRALKRDRETREVPIIMLTARADEQEKIAGLEAGADDYITKPFSPRELAARIKALLRRRAPQLSGDVVEVEGLRLDPSTKKVSAGGRRLELSPAEFRLLHFLMTHPGRVYARAQLLDLVWGDHVFIEERTVDVHIRRLRKALEPSGHDRLIDTVRGSGYGLRTG
jgi:two-component system phosphate regulon response regulator PhoB